MEDIRTEKIISIATIMDKYNYEKNETVERRRINNYDFRANTTIAYNDRRIKISTKTRIRGVYNVLLLFPNGISKVEFEFNR